MTKLHEMQFDKIIFVSNENCWCINTYYSLLIFTDSVERMKSTAHADAREFRMEIRIYIVCVRIDVNKYLNAIKYHATAHTK